MTLFVSVQLILLLWIIINGLLLPRLDRPVLTIEETPAVSVLIPMRNEARNIAGCIASCKALTYPNVECIILDDHSTDRTNELLVETIDGDQRFTVINGADLPDGWVGKVHACKQLSEHAKGEFFLFLDADVRFTPDLIEQALSHMKKTAGLISGFPHYPLKGTLAHFIVPLQHMIIFMHLPMPFANWTKWPAASASHGAFMMFRAEAYRAAGGHEAVKNSLVEDVHLTRNIKKAGWYTRLTNPTKTVDCYMYDNDRDVWNGFSKNSFPGIGRRMTLGAALVIFYFLFFVFPLLLLPVSLVSGQMIYAAPFVLSVLMKFSVDLVTGQKKWLALFTPVSFALLIALLFYSAYLDRSKRGFSWKGRSYQ
ncbi:glycosyltransferase [Salisediminibacterium halotolerans]|uniref:Glycosyltransferase, catalytic subunit of cellulose synthase and poly-beta-1,6-N-acetylglucosamine synthase n=1 Tax=Salisediminibacterium halotolerans TaxID=517425 RepID=A0A1H9PAI0_9BACI|nr:glycosyltransferase family 2 protein [Salisediminibacterium haloalkalitolerans]SER45206.1 Glycosyltransferase, catalytic subunit of cellulose synthase and poly-beta-1,6-N-acetylglucosamine synthase [Salisediminibacterium haloalkalitolerans]